MKLILIQAALFLSSAVFLSGYDSLVREGNIAIERTYFRYDDRKVPLKIYLPESKKKAPVILLSHGLGGSREIGGYLGELWASRGFIVVAMQHQGSDGMIWKDVPDSKPAAKLIVASKAANGKTFRDRMKDVPATLDQLEKWQKEEDHILKGRMNLEKIGIGGHSYGAVTTQALAGQNFGPMEKPYYDDRIDAALALSPSPPRMGVPAKAFSQIEMPMMLMTGSKDGSPIGRTTPEKRRKVYPALIEGDKYQLVLEGAEHHAFSDHNIGKRKRNPNHHRVIQALSTAFWESYLTEDAEAHDWLKSRGVNKLLQKGDLWQKK